MSNIEDFVIENGVLKKYNGPGGDVVIPNGITEIGFCAFLGCSSLISITIPAGVIGIGFSSFSNCSNLTSITLPDGIIGIGNMAFNNCTSLTSIIIPEGVTQIGWCAFYNCSGLTSITIPESITEISKNTFSGCSSLTSIIIPEGVTEIRENAFSGCSSLSSIIIPEGVTAISENTFSGCSSLSSITLPESIKVIGESAFLGCVNLTSIILPEGVAQIGVSAFTNCTKLLLTLEGSSVYFYPSVIFKNSEFCPIYAPRISLEDFEGTKTKKYVILGYLEHLEIEDTISEKQKSTYIKYMKSHKDVRFATYELAKINAPIMRFLITHTVIPLKEYEGLLKKVSDTDNTEIKSMLLEYWNTSFSTKQKIKHTEKTLEIHEPTATELKTLWITKKKEDGTLEIGGYKGQDSDICIPVSVGKYEVTSIGEYSFSPGAPRVKNASVREAITSVMIPESVTEIGAYAFWGCSSLTSITLSKAVTKIGAYAFWDCGSLTSITIPDSVVEIGDWAFYNCSNLTDITIPESVKKLGEWPFCGCSRLTIRAPSGSYAATYAERHSIPFVAE